MTTDWSCPEGHTELYQSPYLGHRYGCDCIGICGYYMDGCYRYNLDADCTRNQTMYGCREFAAFPAVFQSQFAREGVSYDSNAVRVCAKQGDLKFIDA